MRFPLWMAAFLISFASPAMAQADQPSAYVKAGMPSPSRVWLGEDYAQAVSVLKANTVSLPRFSDGDGAAILNRMTATENLERCRDQSSPSVAGIDNCRVIVTSVQELLTLYIAALPPNSEQQSAPEEIALAAYALRIGGAIVEALHSVPLALIKDEAQFAAQRAALDARAAGVFLDYTAMLGMKDGTTADKSVILKAMSDTFGTYKRVFSSDDQRKLARKLADARASFTSAEDRSRLNDMIARLTGDIGDPWKLRGQPERYVDVPSLPGKAAGDGWWKKYQHPPINAREH